MGCGGRGAGPRGRLALPRAPSVHISNAVGFWPKPRAERPRAARQAVGLDAVDVRRYHGGRHLVVNQWPAQRFAAAGGSFVQNSESLEPESASNCEEGTENHAALLKETPPHTSDRARPLEGTGLRENRPRRREPRETPPETPSHYEQHNNTLLTRSSPRRTSPARTAASRLFVSPRPEPPPPPSPAAQHVS